MYAARALSGQPVSVTLIDRTNHHLFQPLLYQVATAMLSPADIAQPIRAILKEAQNVRVVMGTVETIDPGAKVVRTKNNDILEDVRKTSDLSSATEAKLKGVVEAYANTFA